MTKIAKSIAGVAGIVFLSRILGFVREMIIADRFGTTDIYDLYLIAVMLPALVYGVINFAGVYFFVPYITRRLNATQNNEDGWRAIWPVVNITHLITFFLTIGIILFSPYLMKIWASAYTAEQFTKIIFYSRITSLVVLLGTMEAFLRSFLNVKKVFTYPAGGYIVFNLISISFIVLLSGSLSVTAIAYGLVCGVLGQTIYLMIRVLTYKPFKNYRLTFFDESTSVFFAAAGIVLLIELINRSYFLFDRYFAPKFGDGIVASLNYAQVLIQLPDSIIGFAIGSVVFPLLSESNEQLDFKRFGTVYSRAIISAVLIGIPIAIGYLVLAPELITLLFKRGAFNQQSVEMTVQVLQPYIFSIVALFVISTSLRAGYALNLNKYIFLMAIIFVIVKWQGNIWLGKYFGYPGLSASTALAHTGFAVFLLARVRKRSNMLQEKQFPLIVVKLLLIGIILGTGIYYLKPYIIFSFITYNAFDIIMRVAIVGFVIIFTYAVSLWISGLYPNLQAVMRSMKREA